MESWTTLPIGDVLRVRANEQPDAVFSNINGTELSYGAGNNRANRLANAILSLRLEADTTVGYMLRNSLEALDCWFGLAKTGIVQVPINVAQRGAGLKHILNTARCSTLIVSSEDLPQLTSVIQECESVRYILVTGGLTDPQPLNRVCCFQYDELLLNADCSDPSVAVRIEDPECILFTSGTTGLSKGVIRSHQANLGYAADVIGPLQYSPNDVLYSAFPLFHAFTRYNCVFPMMLVGGKSIVPSRFSVAGFWSEARQAGVTAFNFLGSTLIMLYKQPAGPEDRAHSVVKGFGSPIPVPIHHAFEERFGVRLIQGYGLTEVGIVTVSSLQTESILGSCGRPGQRYSVEIHDDAGFQVDDGRIGEIVVRPNMPGSIYSGYCNAEKATLAASRDLWFHTGDRGYRDAAGYFYFVDRLKDAIRRRGENISSWEMEEILNGHPDIAESAVVGVPSELSEEDVLVVAVLKPDREPDPEGLYTYCLATVPKYALPRFVRYVDALPKTPTFRIEKYRLRDEGVTEGCWEILVTGKAKKVGDRRANDVATP